MAEITIRCEMPRPPVDQKRFSIMAHLLSSRLFYTLLLLAMFGLSQPNSIAATRAPGKYLPRLRANSQSNQKLSKKDTEAQNEIERLYQESRKLLESGQHDAALPLAERALTLAEKTFASKSPTIIANTANNLARIYHQKGDIPKAESLYLRSLAIFEKYPETMPDAGIFPLTNLARLYLDKPDYDSAEPLYQRALTIKETRWGANHPETALTLYYLAAVYAGKGDYERTESIARRALDIFEKSSGTEHPNVALMLEILGSLLQNKGDYAEAESLFQRVLAIREKAFGNEHISVAQSLYTIANLTARKGDYGKAEPLYRRALTIQEKAKGAQDRFVAVYLKGLASLYMRKGDFAQAEPLLQRSLSITEKTFGLESAFNAHAIRYLAYIYAEKGDYTQAERFYQRSRTLIEKTAGKDNFQFAFTLADFADLYMRMGDYARAEPLLQQALVIEEKALGQGNHALTSTLTKLAILNDVQGEHAKAISFMRRSTDISEHNLALIVFAGSEEQKRLYLATLTKETDTALSLHVRSAPNDIDAVRLALTTALRRKGRVLDAMTNQIGTLRRRSNPQDRSLLDQLAAVNSQRATLTLREPDKSDPSKVRAQVEKLEAEASQLETQISARSIEFRTQSQPVTIERIQQAIPAGAALVEIMSYRTLNPKAKTEKESFGAARYVAYVLRREDVPTFADLGEAAPIDRVCAQFRTSLSNPRRTDVKQAARALDEMVMRPVRKLLGSTRTIIISPDGALNLIPFSALMDEQQRYLVESYSITYLTSGRDLLRLQVQAQSRQGPVAIANPTFDQAIAIDGQPDHPAEGMRGRRSVNFSRLQFNPLPGTAGEAKALKSILTNAQVLTEAQATEAALKQVAGPRILHIATHGFFLPDQSQETVSNTRGLSLDSGPQAARGENPLLRSGLALAGANKRQSGAGEDGILTALETAGLDLWGTKLVVLSACETGVGEATNGEGVYGLRRALVLAGAESELMSLWQVSDAATRDLMVEYYKHLQAGEGRSDALRQVQLKMLKSGQQTQPPTKRGVRAGRRGLGGGEGRGLTQAENRSHPFFWASFIPIGDWRSLEAKDARQN